QFLEPLLQRMTQLESLKGIEVQIPPGVQANIDADQLEQALINLCKNAVEAQDAASAVVRVAVELRNSDLRIEIVDGGPGIANPDNLFVPFFTTKPDGSGIGLILSRQIAEAHGGTLTLESRSDCKGAIARLELPAAGRL